MPSECSPTRSRAATDDQQRALIRFSAGELANEHDQVAALEHFQFAAEHSGDDVLRVKALGWLAGLLQDPFSDDNTPALDAAAEAVRIAERSGDPLILSVALRETAETHYRITGEIRRDMSERAIALAAPLEDDVTWVCAVIAHANTLVDAWELDEARQLLHVLIARNRSRGSADLAGELDLLAMAELYAGNLRAALPLAREAVELAGQTGRLDTELYNAARLGWIEGLLGDVERARRTCDRAIRLAEQGAGYVRIARLSRGYLESSLEEYDTAFAYLDPADPRTGIVTPRRPLVHIPELIEVLVELGRLDEARDRLDPYEQRSIELDRTYAIARSAHCRGLLLAAEGDSPAPRRPRRAPSPSTPNTAGRCISGDRCSRSGSVQRRRGHKAEARATLERAVSVLDEAGAAIWCGRARRELGRIGGRAAPAGSHLSATEARIAELVATGHSNAEVAAALHVSRKTVEWNLSKIYRKLGVRSRTELAARGTSVDD